MTAALGPNARAPRKSRRVTIALVAIASSLILLGVFAAKPFYAWITTKKIYCDRTVHYERTVLTRGYRIESRLRPGVVVGERYWYPKSGYPAYRNECHDGLNRITQWRPNGTVELQVVGSRDGYREVQLIPPWRWGVSDEPLPSMPRWMRNDASWREVLARK